MENKRACRKGLLNLCMTPVQEERAKVASIFKAPQMSKSYLWHLRLGHIGHSGLDAIVKQNLGVGIDIASVNKWELCSGCALGNQPRVSIQSTMPERTRTCTAMFAVQCRLQRSPTNATL